MRFKKDSQDPQLFLHPTKGVQAFIYAQKGFQLAEIDCSELFDSYVKNGELGSYGFKFIMVFHKTPLPTSGLEPATKQRLNELLESNEPPIILRRIYWVDDLSVTAFNDKGKSSWMSIYAGDGFIPNEVRDFNNFGKGELELPYGLNFDFATGGTNDQGRDRIFINYEPQSVALEIYIIDSQQTSFSVRLHNQTTFFRKIIIPLQQNTQLQTKKQPHLPLKTYVKQHIGALCMELEVEKGQLLPQARIPFVLELKEIKDNGAPVKLNKSLIYSLFDAKSYQQSRILLTFFPFYTIENNKTESSSYLEVVRGSWIPPQQERLVTNFADEYGRKLSIPLRQNFLARLTYFQFLERVPSQKYDNYWLFLPEGGQVLDFPNEELDNYKQMLLSNSGTERLEKADLRIVESNAPRIVPHEQEPPKFESLGDPTCKTVLFQLSNSTHKKKYYLDSEKAPYFENDLTKGNTQLLDGAAKSTYVQTDAFVPKILSSAFPIPIIPTFSFAQQDKLNRLDLYFKQYRITFPDASDLNMITASGETQLFPLRNATNTKLITPQGFIRTNKRYDFIKPPIANRVSERGINRPQTLTAAQSKNATFQFSVESAGADFELSMRNDQVFFVLTPSLYKAYQQGFQAIRLKINFAVNPNSSTEAQFKLDLNALFSSSALAKTHEKAIIIFKFHQKSLQALLDDPTQWSNKGALRSDLEAIRQNTANAIKAAKESDPVQFPAILENENWNGVILLNVPISSGDDLPPIFKGLMASQELKQKDPSETAKQVFETELKFQYVAIPVNKTTINTTDKEIGIKSSSFYGVIDYDVLKNAKDAKKVREYFDKPQGYKFLLTKLFVRFSNSEVEVGSFQSYAFIQVPTLFEDDITFKETCITHSDKDDCKKEDKVPQLLRLQGAYQEDSSGRQVFSFAVKGKVELKIEKQLLRSITVKRLAFSYDTGRSFRFDIDAKLSFNTINLLNIFSFEEGSGLEFKNIGLSFSLEDFKIPLPKFDLSRVSVFPNINFDGDGFLSSFPIKFKGFKLFKFKKNPNTNKLEDVDWGFITLNDGSEFPKMGKDWLNDVKNTFVHLYTLLFDFDLGTLGNLDAFKALKGQLALGWAPKGGFSIGFKLKKSAKKSVDINLFGAVRFYAKKIDFGTFTPEGTEKTAYYLLLEQAWIKILDLKKFPPKGLDALIIADFKSSKKIAWFMTSKSLPLMLGQRVGPKLDPNRKKVQKAINATKDVFIKAFGEDGKLEPTDIPYQPQRNWLVASEKILPDEWDKVVGLKFIFNDPEVYGLHVSLKKTGFEVDVLYQKLSDKVGKWSGDIRLPAYLRNQEFGAASITLPNLGLEVFTNGGWGLDIGFPKSTNNWDRSAVLQIFPFVGWGGFYLRQNKSVGTGIFSRYWNQIKAKEPKLVQAGFAFRIGLGKYIQKGPFYAGASISVYGVLEGAFAFNTNEAGIDKFFPDHFALKGRLGAIAEVVGYVDFKLVKAAVYLYLKVEFGVLLAVINGKLQEVPVYISGEVGVAVRVTIACVKVFGKRFCIVVTFRFRTRVRFEYVLGKSSSKNKNKNARLGVFSARSLSLATTEEPKTVEVALGKIPMLYSPTVSQRQSKSGLEPVLVHNFCLNLFGYQYDEKRETVTFANKNVLKTNILRPILAALAQRASKYSEFRTWLAEDDKARFKFFTDATTKRFIPTLYLGFEVEDAQHLKAVYGLNEVEYRAYKATFDKNICGDETDNCLMRPMVMPIAAHLEVQQKTATGIATNEFVDGFDIDLKGLFNQTITTAVRPIPCNISAIQQIEAHYKDYRTQLPDEKANDSLKGFTDTTFDLRDDFAVSEYFQLIASLTLEACHEVFLERVRQSEHKDYLEAAVDPIVTLIEDAERGFSLNFKGTYTIDENQEAKRIVSFEEQVDPNEVLEQVLGQVNYFYNSGLRLPWGAEGENGLPIPMKAYAELLELTSPIEKGANNAATLDIRFSKENATANQETANLALDILGNAGDLENYYKEAQEVLGINWAAIKQEFAKDNTNPFSQPYSLVDLNLTVVDSTIMTDESTELQQVFYKIPTYLENILQEKRALSISYDLYQKDAKNLEQKVDFEAVAQVEFKVSNRTVAKEDQIVLELKQIKIEDLNLLVQLYELASFKEQTITLYLKQTTKNKADNSQQTRLVELDDTTILKTNLSPKTAAPEVVKLMRFRSLNEEIDQQEIYHASINEPAAFMKLLYEGLLTNNGGYFLQLDKPAGGEIFTNSEDISLIFELVHPTTPAFYCNYLKVPKAAIQSADLSLKNIHINQQKVLEYHPTLPAHCVAFSLKRQQTAEIHPFLPLDYEVWEVGKESNKLFLSKDKVLPVMPTNDFLDDISSVSFNAAKLDQRHTLYKHVTPISNPQTPYAAIGKAFQFKFGLRDIYGHRFAETIFEDTVIQHQHVYTDQIIGLNAWPNITLANQLEGYNANENSLEWKLTLTYKQEKQEKQEEQENEENAQEILQNAQKQLRKIKQQLEDKNLVVYLVINSWSEQKPKQQTLDKQKFISLIDEVLLLDPDVVKDVSYEQILGTYTFPLNKGLKTVFDVHLSFKREGDHFLELEEKNELIVGFKATKEAITTINVYDKGTQKDKAKITEILADLNAELMKLSTSNYCLGIGSFQAKQLDKAIFFIDTRPIKDPFKQIPEDLSEHYYGVLPFSRQLWSGKYYSSNQWNYFTNIDLDVALELTLFKINQLLDPDAILKLLEKKNPYQWLDKLLEIKEAFSASDGVLLKQLESLNTQGKTLARQQEFRNLLRENLSNFYQVDGLIELPLKLPAALAGHRLNLDFNRKNKETAALAKGKEENLNITSSKVDSKKSTWTIIFDDLLNNNSGRSSSNASNKYNFDLNASVTHIEYNIKDQDNTEVDSSEWIQLIEPIHLAKHKVSKFPQNERSYPPNPVILASDAKPKNSSDEVQPWNKKLGKWDFELKLEDSAYVKGDYLTITLEVKSIQNGNQKETDQQEARASSASNINAFDVEQLKSFLGYWSGILSADEGSVVQDKQFIKELHQLLQPQKSSFLARNSSTDFGIATISYVTFNFKKIGEEQWELINDLDANTLQNLGVNEWKTVDEVLTIVIGGADLFDPIAPIVSIRPNVQVIRNKGIKNPNFHYKTDRITTTAWTTPQLRYQNPLWIEQGRSFEQLVFGIIPVAFPFKATAKYILDIDPTKSIVQVAKLNRAVLPIAQLEYEKNKPQNINALFEAYRNGYPAFSLTIYNQAGSPSELPIFHAEVIFEKRSTE